jgi:uncharacterized protein (DUF1697 family)
MSTAVALVRGINLGNTRKIAMADLRTIVTEAGGDDVTTYIQSGNVVFRHAKATASSAAELEVELERRIEAATGFDVPVMVRTARQWAAVVRDNPFPGADAHLHVAFLKKTPSRAAAQALDPAAFRPDEFALVRREVYLHLPNGVGPSKLPQALSALATPSTVRNWRTVTKLLELAGG